MSDPHPSPGQLTGRNSPSVGDAARQSWYQLLRLLMLGVRWLLMWAMTHSGLGPGCQQPAVPVTSSGAAGVLAAADRSYWAPWSRIRLTPSMPATFSTMN
jgi:hypothetical protein